VIPHERILFVSFRAMQDIIAEGPRRIDTLREVSALTARLVETKGDTLVLVVRSATLSNGSRTFTDRSITRVLQANVDSIVVGRLAWVP
jgi:hypothetical protein